MAAKNKFMNAMKMPAIADMFSSEADRQRESGDLVTEVPLSELHPFVNHPFEVRDDEDMQKLVDSIKENGVLTNLTVRPRAEGGYEIISGHRRFHAAQLAGLDKIKVQVRDVDDDQAIIDMVDANIQREHISPMEKARAYAMKLEASCYPVPNFTAFLGSVGFQRFADGGWLVGLFRLGRGRRRQRGGRVLRKIFLLRRIGQAGKREQVLRPVLSVHVDLIGKRTRLRHSADMSHRHAHQGTGFRCFQ